jgi:hypothetical protein
MEGIPALILWDQVISVFSDKTAGGNSGSSTSKTGGDSCVTARGNSGSSTSKAGGDSSVKTENQEPYEILRNIDWVPPSLPKWHGKAKLLILEDNDAVIKMTIKGRSPALRHVP